MAAQRTRDNDLAATDAASARSPEQAPLKLEEFLPYQLTVVSNLVVQALSRIHTRRHRLGVPEWRVLVTLGQFRVMTGRAIGQHTHMHKTKVSRAAASLEKRGLIARRTNRADMRESLLSLSPSGLAMYEDLAPQALDFVRRLTDILSPEDRGVLDRTLRLIIERSAQLIAETGAPHKASNEPSEGE